MAHPLKEPPHGLLFWSVLFRSDVVEQERLCRDFRSVYPQVLAYEIDLCTSRDYYAKEMGDQSNLKRIILFSLEPVVRSSLISAKHWSYAIESALSLEGRRLVNIDPGLLTLEQVVLSTFKPYAHRLFLADGVFGELCLQFKEGDYRPLPWTYPDYIEPQITEFFQFLRSFLKREKTFWKNS